MDLRTFESMLRGNNPQPQQTQQMLLNQLQQYNWEEWEKQNQQPTVNSTLAKIYQISTQDNMQGNRLAYQFMQLQNDPTSMFYNPFTKPTNPAVQAFADEGIDVSNINDEWFEQYSWLKNYYETSGTTNNVKAPTNNSTREQKLAYSYNQLLQQREKTNLAEQESKALREELTYWAQQTDRNYSDDEIMSRVNWSKYPTLAEMRIQGTIDKGTPIELNRAVPGWSDDWMKGVLWAARNDGGSGNDNMNQAYSAMGIGNQWQENEEISRRLNPNDDAFCPYKVGSTMSNERQLFGVSGFDDEWLATGKPGPNASDAENKGYKRVREAEAFTKTAEEEAAKFKEWFDRQATRWKKPEDALKDLDRMVERYPSLKKLNDSLKDAGTDGLIDTTRAIDFSLYDYQQMAREICEKNQNAPTVTSVLKTHDMAVITDQQAAVAEAQDQKVNEFAGAMDGSGTPAERNVFSLTPSTMYNLAVEKLKSIETGINKIISTAMPLVSAKSTSDMIPLYTDVNSNREAKEALTGINDRLAALNNAYFDKYDDTQKGSLYAISQGEEFMKMLAEDPTNTDLLNYIYYELYPGTEYNEEAAKAAAQTLLEGIPDPNELVKLESQKAEYESIIERTSGAEQQLSDKLDQMNHLIDVYEKSGINTTEMRTGLAVSKAMQYFSEYEATKWEPYNTYELMMLDLDSGEGYEAVREKAEQLNQDNVSRLEAYQAMRDYLIDNNISVADDYMNNLNRLIDKLERDKTDYEYFSMMGDADFDKIADRGLKHFNENYDEARLAAEYNREGYYTIEDSRYYDLLTDDEKKTYFYLYEKGGLKEANKYLDYLSDGTYGVLTTRFTENQKQYAQNEVRGGFLNAAWANMKALISAPLEGINGIAYLLDAAISGKELNPNSPLLTLSAFSNATMAESTQAIKDGLKDSGIGEDSVLGQIALGAYEIFYNRGRSMANGVLTGGITSGITNSIVQELVGASVMALGAGATAAAEAKAKGAQDWQAYLIGAVTTVMEDFTEGITYSNIQDVLHGVKDAAENGVVTGLKDKVVSWLTKEGPQEMFGETLTDVVEGLTDTMVMRGLSDHADRVASFVEKGMTQEEAEQAAFRDEISGILHTALISYLSPGADIPTATIGETINSYNYVRETTREMQKQGMDTNMLETMRQYRAFRQQQKAEAKDRKENPMKYAPDRVYEEVSEQEANAVAPAEQTAVEQTAQEAAPETPQLSEADMALLKNLGVLDASYDADTSSQTASMAATFGGVDGTVEGDMSKAAACAAAELFGVDFNQEYKALLVTDHELGADGEDVKHAVMTASLSQSSEARAVMTSPEYKTMPAAKKVALLKDTIARDNGNQTVMDEITQNTHEYRVAETEKTLIANGQIASVEDFKQKQATADKAAQALNQAREDLKARQDEEKQKSDNVEAAVQAFISDTSSDDNVNNMNHAINELEKAQTVTKEYEQHLTNTEETNSKAQQDADAAKQQALTDLRQEAERIVADQNAQREERAAQEKALRDQREQEAAKAKAEADEISGKAEEDRRDALIEDLLNRDQLEGEEREQKKQEYLERAEQIKLGKIDMTGLMNNTEGTLAVAAFGRKLGLSFQLSDTLPETARGKYQNGVVYLNNSLIKNGKMTIGQALVEASLHEITHSMEETKNYKTYRKVVLDTLFGGENTAAYRAAIEQKQADYRNSIKQNLTPEQAEKEIIADFARTKLNGKEVVQRFMDAGLGGKMRNSLHNINQALKNFRLTGEERTSAEYLRKAERAFQKALNEVAKTEVHPEGGQFSIAQIAQATGMTFDEKTLTLYDRNGKAIDGVTNRITPDMIEMTPAGMLINSGLQGEQNTKAKDMMAGLMNLVARYKDSNLVWEIGATTLSSTFSAIKSNSDPQYKTTVDFGTVCAKTQAIIDVMSQVMLDRVKQGKTGGLNRKEIMKVYDEVNKAGLSVPCPVCYVFSRWMGVPSLLGQMSQYQNDYVVTEKDANGKTIKDKNGDAVIDVKATQKKVDDYIRNAEAEYGDAKAINNQKSKLQSERAKLEEKRSELVGKSLDKSLSELEKKSIQSEIQEVLDKMVDADKKIGEVSAYNWITQALCKKVDGKFVVDSKFKLTPDEILFNLNRTGEFAGYEKNWAYRNTRGAGMGKAIMPYSGETIGDVLYGVKKGGRQNKIKNPWLNLDDKAAARQLKNAQIRAKKQNLVGGQRLQSTSDFRPEWGLDYIMSFLELQAAKSKVQMYTKVGEAVDFFASVGADVNLSIMAKNNGFHEASAEEIAEMTPEQRQAATVDGKIYVMDFSSITGMDYGTATGLKNKYDNVQMILVGMNDTHIRLAMKNSDIDFIIPWHSSGNSKDTLSGLIASVGEKLNSSVDYTTTQTDMVKGTKKTYTDEKGNKVEYTVPGEQTEAEKALWDARVKLITKGGDALNQAEREALMSNPITRALYYRFTLKEGESVTVDGVTYQYDPDCSGVKLPGTQAKQIFPYEYWNTKGTKETADENGKRFVEYCEAMGLVPRFSQFKDDPGYWKLLIDRPMYNNDGSYHEQQVIDVTNARIGDLDESGKLVDSDLPTKAQAKYAPKDPRNENYEKYTEAEKQAIMNAEASIEAKYDDGTEGQYSVFEDEETDDTQYSAGGDVTTADLEQIFSDYQDAVDQGDTEAAQEGLNYIRETYGEDAAMDAEYMDAVRRDDTEKLQQMVNQRAEELKAEVFAATDVPAYKIRRGPTPKRTIKVYKTFTLDENGRPSALFVSSKNALPVGVWLDAQDTYHFTSTKNGRMYVPSTKNPNTKGGATGTPINLSDISETDLAELERLGHIKRNENGEWSAKSLTSLAYRPGWHAGDMPFFPQGGMKIEGSNYENVHRYNQVVFECEMAADNDYTSYDIRDDGTVAYHDRQEMPADGSYKFATNPMANAQDIGAWYISGALKINRALTEEECNEILAENGRNPQEWQQYQNAEELKLIKGKENKYQYEHSIGPLDLDALGYDPEMTDSGKKLLDPITYDDNGNVIPLSKRFNAEIPDARYSTGGERTTADIDQELLDAGIVTQEDLDKMQQKSVGEGQRQFGQGMLQESNEIDELAKQYVLAHNEYTQDSNEGQINRAIKWIHGNRNHADSDGYQESLAKVTSGRFNYRTADGQARMVAVMGMAVAKGDISAQVQLADAFNKQGTDLGQALQARKLFRMMTPEGRIASIQKMLNNTQDELNAKGTNVTLKFSDWIYQAAAMATEEGDMQKVQQAAAQELAAQLPANWRDKFRGWRMLSMLGNPRTHIRNVVGNALFIPAVGLKNKVAAVMELGVKQGNKTKTLAPFLSKEVRDFARKDAEFMKDTLTGEAKYNEENAVQKEQKPFKGLLQAIIDFNSNALEKEDWIFLKGHYRRALGGWMQANGYTAEQLQNDAKLLETGRAYAVEEAQKATYRDFSKLASTLNKVSRDGGVAGFVVDAALPFKKTPANILKRGMEYSPIGLIRSLTTDIYHLKQWQDAQDNKLNAMPEKALSPTQFIDRLCSGLAGTAIMAVGALLGNAGIVSCGLDDDEDELEKAKGNQEYSFKFSILGHDYTYTVDWAAPMSMPFFVGAAIQEQLANQQGFDIESLVDAVGNISEPVYNLSMLDGINSLFKTSQSVDTDTLTQIGAKIASNYITSYLPSFLGAVTRSVFDDTRRKAFVESGKGTGVVGTFRYAWEQTENKIPGLSKTNIPYRDVFGRPETSSLAERLFENFISPGYISEYRNDPVLNEIGRLYDVNAADVGSLVPDDPAKSVTYNKEKYVLSAEQWDQYKAVRGETAYKLLNQLIQSSDYQDADTTTQAQMIKDTWSYADKVGRSTFIPDYELPNMGENPVANISRTSKITGYKNEMIKALNAEDYTAYETMVQALRDADVEDSEIKTKIGDTFRDLYKEAYRRNDEQGRQRMREIEDMLLMTGFNFDVYAWQEQVDKKYNQ